MALGAMVSFICIHGAFAQTAAAPAGSTPAPASEENVSMSSGGNVSLDFRDADIRNVLQILSYKSGVNIVAGPEVTGLVSIQLRDVPWQQALEVILQTYGFASEKKGKIMVVTTVENLKKIRENAVALAEQESLETRTFTINHRTVVVQLWKSSQMLWMQ